MTLEQRMVRLERQNKRLRSGLCAVAAAGLAVLAIGAAVPGGGQFNRITAREIRVVDAAGRMRVHIGTTPKRGGTLVTYADTGKPLTALTWGKRGDGSVAVYNRGGRQVAKMSATKSAHGMVQTYNSRGRRIVILGAARAGDGAIVTYNTRSRSTVRIGSTKVGEGAIASYRRSGRIKAVWPKK